MTTLLAFLVAALPQQDDPYKRIMERVARELQESEARLRDDLRRIIREEIEKSRTPRPKAELPADLPAKVSAFADQVKDDGGLNGRLKKFLKTKEGVDMIRRLLEEQGAPATFEEGVDMYCQKDKDGKYVVKEEFRDALRELLDQVAPEKPAPATPAPEAKRPYIGIVAGELTDEERKTLGIGGGIKVEEARGPAEKAGIRSGDILLAIGSTAVTEDNINALLSRHKPGDEIELTVLRGKVRQTLKLTLGERKE